MSISAHDPEPTRAFHFCVMHNAAFFNDVVGCSPRRQARPMRRREFITLLGGAAAWVSLARAQESRKVIGFLGSASSDTYPADAVFLQGLKDAGFIEGKNISIEWRWAEGQYNRLPSLAGELVSRGVAVIAAFGAPAAFAARRRPKPSRLYSRPVPIRSRRASLTASADPAVTSPGCFSCSVC